MEDSLAPLAAGSYARGSARALCRRLTSVLRWACYARLWDSGEKIRQRLWIFLGACASVRPRESDLTMAAGESFS